MDCRRRKKSRSINDGESGGAKNSKNIGDGFFWMVLNASIVNIFGARGADFVGGNAVGGGVDEFGEGEPKVFEGGGIEPAFEDGVLNAESVFFAEGGYFLESFGIGDVVGNEGKHLFGATAVAGDF